MTEVNGNTALILIDFINDIVARGGKLAGKGYSSYLDEHHVDEKVSKLLAVGRSRGWKIFHVRVAFETDYSNHPAKSPLFGGAKKFEALRAGEWGTEFASFAQPNAAEEIIQKSRVSAFYRTSLEDSLEQAGLSNVVIAGCATDLAVQSAARDAHDRDYKAIVVQDACAAASEEDHINSLAVLQKISAVVNVKDIEADRY